MKFKKRYIILFLFILLVVKWEFKNYNIKKDKETIVLKLEDYKKTNLKYPSNLGEIKMDINTNFNYRTDSLNKTFRLNYLEGFMDLVCVYYDSRYKIWKYEYSE